MGSGEQRRDQHPRRVRAVLRQHADAGELRRADLAAGQADHDPEPVVPGSVRRSFARIVPGHDAADGDRRAATAKSTCTRTSTTSALNRLLTRDLALSADFTTVLRYGDRDTVEINIPDQVTRQRPYPTVRRVCSSGGPTADNTYTALLLKVEKRMSRHYQALVSYTLSKAEDNSFTSALSDRYGYTKVERPGVADRRHRLVVSGIVALPFDMQLSAIGDFRSSLPFGPVTSGLDLNNDTLSGTGFNPQTSDLPAGVMPLSGCRSLNLDAINQFRTQRSLTPVTQVDCPGFANVDLRFSKFFRIGGSARAEFIAQLFNIFDRANFATPNNNIGSANDAYRPAAVRHDDVAAREHQRAVAAGGVCGAVPVLKASTVATTTTAPPALTSSITRCVDAGFARCACSSTSSSAGQTAPPPRRSACRALPESSRIVAQSFTRNSTDLKSPAIRGGRSMSTTILAARTMLTVVRSTTASVSWMPCMVDHQADLQHARPGPRPPTGAAPFSAFMC